MLTRNPNPFPIYTISGICNISYNILQKKKSSWGKEVSGAMMKHKTDTHKIFIYSYFAHRNADSRETSRSQNNKVSSITK